MSSFIEPQVGWLQLVLLAISLVVVHEVAYRVGRRRRDEVRDAKTAQADVAVTALLALLALLLAFSFDIGATRYDRRKQLVLDEANSIVTTYLRADLVSAPYDDRIHELLREYLRVRLEARTPAELERAIKQSATILDELWANATAAGRVDRSPVMALFIDSLNRTIDLHESRVTVALYHRVPPALFVTLHIVAMLAIGMLGLRAGLDRLRDVLTAGLVIASIMCVTALIASLDDPTSRLLDINKHALLDAQQSITEHATAAAR